MGKRNRGAGKDVVVRPQNEEQEQKQELLQEAQGRLSLSELVPPCLVGLSHVDDPELPLIEEIGTGEFKPKLTHGLLKLPYIMNPAFLGKANL